LIAARPRSRATRNRDKLLPLEIAPDTMPPLSRLKTKTKQPAPQPSVARSTQTHGKWIIAARPRCRATETPPLYSALRKKRKSLSELAGFESRREKS